ncbi:MAG: hypothetical protein J0L88_04755 [Xanthomonadales bacterium]|nr:hypothetical protein [Xanthomonadales bacterium]
MNPIPASILALVSAFAVVPAAAAEPARSVKTPKGATSGQQRTVDYTDLEKHVGAQISVHTTNDTVRSGTLLKYTNVALTMRLGPEAGSIDLSVPRGTVRSVTVTIAPADPLFPNDTFQQEAKPGAQKN